MNVQVCYTVVEARGHTYVLRYADSLPSRSLAVAQTQLWAAGEHVPFTWVDCAKATESIHQLVNRGTDDGENKATDSLD